MIKTDSPRGRVGLMVAHCAGMLDTVVGKMPFKDDPAKVAQQGFDALMQRQQKVVAESTATKLIGLVSRFLPDSVKAAANRLISMPIARR